MVIKMVKKIAFIGVGNMAGAIISGITSRKENPIGWDNIILYDKYSEKCEDTRLSALLSLRTLRKP